MKKNLCLLLVCLLSAAAPLQAQDMQQAQKLIDQAQKYLYNNPKQASYYAAQASALFPEDEPSEVRAQAMYNPQNEMFRLLGTKRSFSQNETFFFSHP